MSCTAPWETATGPTAPERSAAGPPRTDRDTGPPAAGRPEAPAVLDTEVGAAPAPAADSGREHGPLRVGAPPGPAAPGRRARPYALVAALLGFTVITIDVSAVNIALPSIGASLGGGMTGLQWVVDAYTLMLAALILSAGALADRAGARRAYAWGVALFTLTSLACALAPGIGALIAARAAQGAAAAVVLPASLALIRQSYDEPGQRARAIALWTVGGAVAMAAGPVLGGTLAEGPGWRAVFLINVPVGAVILAALSRTARSPRRPAPLDLAGQATAVVALAGVAYAVIEGGRAGWTHPGVAAALVVAVAAGFGFGAAERRHRAPMVPPDMVRQRLVAVPLVIGFAINAAFYGGIFLLGLYYQELRGMSGIEAGLMFVPMAAVITGTNLVSPRLAERVGRRPVIAAGQLIMAVAMLAMLPLDAHTPIWLVLVLLVPLGIGGALSVPAFTAQLLDSVPAERGGTASGLLNALRQTGGALAVAVFGAAVSGPDGGFALSGMRTSLLAEAALLAATAAAAWWLLPRRR